MKINGRVKNLAPSSLLLIMAVAALVAVPLRTYQLVNIIEPTTGFFAIYDISIVILYAVLVVACLMLYLFSYLSGVMPSPELPEKKNVFLGIVIAFFTVSLLFDAVVQIDTFTQIYNDFDATKVRLIDYFIKSGGMAAAVQSLFGVLSAVYFSILAASFFKGKKFYESNRLLALSPIIWGLCRIIQRFIEPISFKNVSELLLQMLMLVFMLIFFLSLARIASNVNCEKSTRVLFSSGLCAALLAFTTAVPSAIVMVMGKSKLLYSQFPITFADIFVAVFIVVLLLDTMPTKSEIEQMSKPDVELVEQTEEELEEPQEPQESETPEEPQEPETPEEVK
ncbi:MAG: hypothetical protein RSD42_00565 [Oscillospiraceae bacterium]